ncbi:MAG TPA: C4-type zinc ribbon domain-containing protein [Chitinophagaceae bacterium]|nr:C4-type zinc ribbon domain-containing protein [Chitinophagaceae bacterium]
MAKKSNVDFSIEDKLKAVITLQKIDSKIDQIEILKGELPIEVSDLDDEVEGLKTRISNTEAKINSIEEFIKRREEDRRDAKANIDKYEEQQQNVNNDREYQAVEREIEFQNLEVQHAEKDVKEAKIKLNDTIKSKENINELLKLKQEIFKSKEAELKKIIKETEKEEKEISLLSEKAKENVDEHLLSSYERIRSNFRNGLAVVPILRDSCGGCFNIIPPQKQVEILQHKKIIICEHCGRILTDDELFEATEY